MLQIPGEYKVNENLAVTYPGDKEEHWEEIQFATHVIFVYPWGDLSLEKYTYEELCRKVNDYFATLFNVTGL